MDCQKDGLKAKIGIWYVTFNMRVIEIEVKLFYVGLTLGAHIAMIVITIILVIAKVKVFPIDFRSFPVAIRESTPGKRDVAWIERFNDDNQRINRVFINDTTPNWPRGHNIDNIEVFFTSKKTGDTIYTKSNFIKMKNIEEKLFDIENYKDFCQLNKQKECLPPVSLIRFFDGTYANIDPIFDDPNYTNIDLVLYTAFKNPKTTGILRYFLSKDFKVDEENKQIISDLTRLKLPLGWPLEKRETNEKDRDKIGDFNYDYIEPELKKIINKEKDVKIHYYMQTIFGKSAIGQAIKDMALAFGSFGFIFIFMWFQTRSFWITGFALLGIVFCFFEANLIYRFIFDFRFFGYFHIIAIFIILGIGADDIFVFFDAWKASGLEEYKSLAHR